MVQCQSHSTMNVAYDLDSESYETVQLDSYPVGWDHIYNEIKPSNQQPISLYEELNNSIKVVHSIKPKITQKKIHNVLPIIDYLSNNNNVEAVLPQIKTQIFYIKISTSITQI